MWRADNALFPEPPEQQLLERDPANGDRTGLVAVRCREDGVGRILEEEFTGHVQELDCGAEGGGGRVGKGGPRLWLEMGTGRNKGGVGSGETCGDTKQAVRPESGPLRAKDTNVGLVLTRVASNALGTEGSTLEGGV